MIIQQEACLLVMLLSCSIKSENLSFSTALRVNRLCINFLHFYEVNFTLKQRIFNRLKAQIISPEDFYDIFNDVIFDPIYSLRQCTHQISFLVSKSFMNKKNMPSGKKRMNRLVSQTKGQPNQQVSQDKKTTFKRRVSCDQLKTVKKTSQTLDNSPKRKSNLSSLANYRVSTDIISFEMEEQRSNQMKAINNDDQLLAYYLAFKKLFTILYQASHLIDQNMFRISSQLFQNKSVGFLGLIFQRPKNKWNQEFLLSLKPLAKNVLFLANNPNQFQRRIDLVARKVTLQNDKREKVRNAFLNPKIQRSWEQTVQSFFSDEEIEAFVEDQFDTPQQKFCFIEIKDFIVNKLSTESFGKQIRRYCVLEQLNDDLSLDFKFEFLLAEEFSFSVPMCLAKDIVKPTVQKNLPRKAAAQLCDQDILFVSLNNLKFRPFVSQSSSIPKIQITTLKNRARANTLKAIQQTTNPSSTKIMIVQRC